MLLFVLLGEMLFYYWLMGPTNLFLFFEQLYTRTARGPLSVIPFSDLTMTGSCLIKQHILIHYLFSRCVRDLKINGICMPLVMWYNWEITRLTLSWSLIEILSRDQGKHKISPALPGTLPFGGISCLFSASYLYAHNIVKWPDACALLYLVISCTSIGLVIESQ